jgi:transketolase
MPKDVDPQLVGEAVRTIQMLAVDGVNRANSGHPGAPMGLASVAFEVWMKQLRFDPADPAWPNRDRFVLSCGHASMLLYGLLHLSGYDLPMGELKQFRQWGSKTPGHPEAHHTPGVETTTGPLGQGFANAVGMATSIKMLAARTDSEIIDARVFCLCSDGDVMEGVSGEASSLAGHLALDNLVVIYDDNGITIDGPTSLAFSEDVGKRYEAYGWFVQRVDGHDHAQIAAALDTAVAEDARPSFIVAKTHIGKGSPGRQDKSKAHGEPLGPDETEATKKNIAWPLEPTFLVPDAVRALFADRAEEGKMRHQAWRQKLARFSEEQPEAKARYDALLERRLPDDLLEQLVAAVPDKEAATRALAGSIQQTAAKCVPSLVGGSADLTPSNKTYLKDDAVVRAGEFAGRNIHFGIREHAMGCFANGMALSDGFIPYTATFLVFSDYMRPAMRLAALSKLQCVFVFTHDSVYLGEDGPTHQPVEHYWALRAIPNLDFVRPADGLECAAAWTHALQRKDGPTVLSLTRQGVPPLTRPEGFTPRDMLRGAYVVDEAKAGTPDIVIIATGSEVSLAVEAKKLLGDKSGGVRVVSAPCLEAFERQDRAYRDGIIPPAARAVSIELGITQPWRGIVGREGLCIGHDDFGYSAPWTVIREKLGMTPEAVAARIEAWLGS